MAWIFRWLGGGSEFQTELYGVDVENKAIEEREAIITVCLQAQIEDGKRLGFRVSPKLCNKNSGAIPNDGTCPTHNPLAFIRDSLTDDDQRAVIRSVVCIHKHSDLGVDLAFELQHPFEDDAATNVIRQRVGAALEADAAPGTATVTARSPAAVNVNNNNNSGPSTAVRLAHPTDSEDYGSLLSEAEDGRVRGDAFAGLSARQKLNEINRITLRGGQHRSNEAERENVINLGVVKALSTTCKQEQVYRASLSDDSIKWFAGQDDVVAEKTGSYYVAPKVPPPPARVVAEGSVSVRGAMPVIPYSVVAADSALITFIKRFCQDMPDIHQRMRPLHTDRADKTVRFYSIDQPLVEEAKAKILYTVYAQMYYTRLSDCIIARRVESELSEESIALKLAADWKLPIDAKTKRISDWSASACRPVVIITLRVLYTVVSGVSASAASLFKTRTRLVPAK
jgi:hypothetical protein